MDFKDWRKQPNTPPSNEELPAISKYYGKRFEDYIGEQIRQARERGEFDNLSGTGKPLQLDSDLYAGDKYTGYHLLKSNGYAPKEIDLAKEIRTEYERATAKTMKVRHLSRTLRARRVPPFPSEKRAFNLSVEKAIAAYEATLRDLNSKILTLNVIAPPMMHQPKLDVEKLVQQFRDECPPFE